MKIWVIQRGVAASILAGSFCVSTVQAMAFPSIGEISVTQNQNASEVPVVPVTSLKLKNPFKRKFRNPFKKRGTPGRIIQRPPTNAPTPPRNPTNFNGPSRPLTGVRPNNTGPTRIPGRLQQTNNVVPRTKPDFDPPTGTMKKLNDNRRRSVVDQLQVEQIGKVACGPASCKMVLSDRGINVDVKKLAREAQLSLSNGTNVRNLGVVLRNNGVPNARVIPTNDIGMLAQSTSKGHSSIVRLNNANGQMGHFVVVDRIVMRKRGNRMEQAAEIRDPWEGKHYFMSTNQLKSRMNFAVLTDPPRLRSNQTTNVNLGTTGRPLQLNGRPLSANRPPPPPPPGQNRLPNGNTPVLNSRPLQVQNGVRPTIGQPGQRPLPPTPPRTVRNQVSPTHLPLPPRPTSPIMGKLPNFQPTSRPLPQVPIN